MREKPDLVCLDFRLPEMDGFHVATLLQQIAELGVNIKSAYATTTVKKSALAVLMTDNDGKVVGELGE